MREYLICVRSTLGSADVPLGRVDIIVFAFENCSRAMTRFVNIWGYWMFQIKLYLLTLFWVFNDYATSGNKLHTFAHYILVLLYILYTNTTFMSQLLMCKPYIITYSIQKQYKLINRKIYFKKGENIQFFITLQNMNLYFSFILVIQQIIWLKMHT